MQTGNAKRRKKMKKKGSNRSISRKLVFLITGFALFLSIVLIILSYTHYRREMFGHYETFGMNIARTAASQINADRIEVYLKTGKPDAAYERVYDILCDIRENGGVEYLYVVKPEKDEVWYVLDTDPTEGAIPLGYHEPYYEGAFKENAEKMVRGEAIEPIISSEEFGWLMSVYYPLKTSMGGPAGYVGVDILMDDVVRDLAEFAVKMVIFMVGMTLLASLILIRIINGGITKPIQKLSAAAGQLVKAEKSGESSDSEIFKNLTIRSKDEIGDLYNSLSDMEKDMNIYIRNLMSVTAEKERITTELSLATRIQADMLPNTFPAFADREDFDIFATMNPAKEVGGDFYDFFLIDDDHLGIVMADVSGKGIPAALFMMASKIVLANNAMLGKSPGEVLTATNDAISPNNREEMFVTVWMGILELSTGKLTAANAGHEYPVIKNGDGPFELFRDKHGFVIGGMAGIRYKEYELMLKPGEKLFLYTDGVPEATDAENTMFGIDRMLAALNEDADAAPTTILKNVRKHVDGFVGDAEQFDDLTMLCLEYKGTMENKAYVNEIVLKAVDENLQEVLDFITGPVEEAGGAMKARMQIEVAAEEIFINIAHYAYAPEKGDVRIRVEMPEDRSCVMITFMDHGIPYNPLLKEDPDVTLSADKRQIGGLGIYITKQTMDGVSYEYKDGQNSLTLTKNI